MHPVGLGLVDHNTTEFVILYITQFVTTMSFQIPRRAILSPEQLAYFQTSKSHQSVISYIESLNNAVVGVKLTDECSESPVRSAAYSFSINCDLNSDRE
jgi:Phosphotyrosyl phosphate activator (PTPA) protein